MKKKISVLFATGMCVAFVVFMTACRENASEEEPEIPVTILAQTSFEDSFAPFFAYHPPETEGKSFAVIVADPTAPDGNKVARISQEPGVTDGDFIAGISYDFPHDDQPTELWCQFYLKLSSNYVWHSIANKIVYMRMGYQHPIDGTSQTDHVMGAYFMEGEKQNPTLGWVTQHAPDGLLNQLINSGTGPLTRDKWYKIVFQIRINTPGQYNGIGRIWLDDAPVVDASDVLWLNTGNTGGVADFRLTPIWGGLGPEVVRETQYMYYDDLILQTGPFPGYPAN